MCLEDGTQNNPFAAEAGMIRCPRKGRNAIAVGRCAEMRSASCGQCPGLLLSPPERSIGPDSYAIQHPYTNECSRAGHRSSTTGAACLTCMGQADTRAMHTAPVCCHQIASSTRLEACPCGYEADIVRRRGCQWRGERIPARGRIHYVCLWRE